MGPVEISWKCHGLNFLLTRSVLINAYSDLISYEHTPQQHSKVSWQLNFEVDNGWHTRSLLNPKLSQPWLPQNPITNLDLTFYCKPLLLLREGFCTSIRKLLRVIPHGLLLGGPPCGPWVFINMGTSLRSRQRIFGDTSKTYVKNSNMKLGSKIDQISRA